MRILITGGHGFLGNHLCQFLRGIPDTTIFAPHHQEFDLRYAHACSALFDYFPRPDIVIHAAAVVGGIGANISHPAQFISDNILMNSNMVTRSRQNGAGRFIGIGSVCGYPGVPKTIPFIEDEFFDGFPEVSNAPYGLTKRLLLIHLQAEAKQYGFRSAFVIPTNMYGPGDNFNALSSHVIPALIVKFHKAKETNEPPVLWGSGKATRDFVYVSDVVNGIYQAALSDYTGPVNLGSGQEISISQLASIIAETTGYSEKWEWDAERPDGQLRRVLDITRALEVLNWHPSVNFDVGLQITYNHYIRTLAAPEGK